VPSGSTKKSVRKPPDSRSGALRSFCLHSHAKPQPVPSQNPGKKLSADLPDAADTWSPGHQLQVIR
jgi:hypothetical protein